MGTLITVVCSGLFLTRPVIQAANYKQLYLVALSPAIRTPLKCGHLSQTYWLIMHAYVLIALQKHQSIWINVDCDFILKEKR